MLLYCRQRVRTHGALSTAGQWTRRPVSGTSGECFRMKITDSYQAKSLLLIYWNSLVKSGNVFFCLTMFLSNSSGNNFHFVLNLLLTKIIQQHKALQGYKIAHFS